MMVLWFLYFTQSLLFFLSQKCRMELNYCKKKRFRQISVQQFFATIKNNDPKHWSTTSSKNWRKWNEKNKMANIEIPMIIILFADGSLRFYRTVFFCSFYWYLRIFYSHYVDFLLFPKLASAFFLRKKIDPNKKICLQLNMPIFWWFFLYSSNIQCTILEKLLTMLYQCSNCRKCK